MILVLLLIASNISALSQKFIIDVKPCYKFDIATFEKNADKNKSYVFYLKEGLKVTQYKSELQEHSEEGATRIRISYQETIEHEGTPLAKRRFYEGSTGSIISELNLFYSCPVGTIKRYDEFGKLYSEVDAEADMPFKLADVIKMVKRDFGVDLTKPRPHMSVSRGCDYSIFLGLDSLHRYPTFRGERINIDGTTGEICLHVKDWQILIDTKNEYPEGLPIIL